MSGIIRGLSLSGPWHVPMLTPRAEGGKRVENRSWVLPKNLQGGYVALHTAKSFDDDAIEFIERLIPGVTLPGKRQHLEHHAGLIVGVGRIVGCAQKPNALPTGWEDQERWFFGEYGFLLADVVKFGLDQRVPHKGAQGFWEIAPGALEQVRAAWLASRMPSTPSVPVPAVQLVQALEAHPEADPDLVLQHEHDQAALEAAGGVTRTLNNPKGLRERAELEAQLLRFAGSHGWPRVQCVPGVAVLPGEDGWRKFVATNTTERLEQALLAARAISPDWWRLGLVGVARS